MTRKHRSTLIIMQDILQFLKSHGETSISQLVNAVRMGHVPLLEKLETLIQGGFVTRSIANNSGFRKHVKPKITYRITSPGLEVLNNISNLSKKMEKLGVI